MVQPERKEQTMANSTSNKTAKPPVAKFRIEKIHTAIWLRETDKGSFYAATFERRYKNGNGEYQSTQVFNADDLLALSKAADLAHTKIAALKAKAKEAEAAAA